MDHIINLINQSILSVNVTTYIILCIFLLLLYTADRISVKYISKMLENILKKLNSSVGQHIVKYNIVKKISHLAPVLIVNISIPFFDKLGLSNFIINSIQKITSIYIIVIITIVILSILSAIQGAYKQFKISSKLPIRNYIQIIKILIIFLSSILVISVILNKSPLVWLTSFGAIAAIFSLAFKDSLTSIIAGVEIAIYDVIRVGDWITIKKSGIDGDIIDITLTRVKVQNFDKTISFISTNEVLNTGMKNWRGMSTAGGRRIKRSFNIDANDIHVLTNSQALSLINNIENAPIDLIDKIQKQEESNIVYTNEMLYRKYIYSYLYSHREIHTINFTLIVRQLDPNENGIPIEIYCFTKNIDWKNYENIQSDIFSTIIANAKNFGLKIYQRSSDFKK